MVSRRRAHGAAPRRCPSGRPRRFALHQLRYAHAVEMAREGVPLIVIQTPARADNREKERQTSSDAKRSTTLPSGSLTCA